MILTHFDFWSTQGWPRAFWSIWLEMALRVLRCPNGLRHVNLDVSMALWRKNNIFEIFGIRHLNWRWTKYGVYSNHLATLVWVQIFFIKAKSRIFLPRKKIFCVSKINASNIIFSLLAKAFATLLLTPLIRLVDLKYLRLSCL